MRDRRAEEVAGRRIRGVQLGLEHRQRGRGGIEQEDVGGARVGDAAVPRAGADERRVAERRHRPAELIGRGQVRGEQLPELAPDAARAPEDVGGAGVGARDGVVVARRADDDGLARDRNREAEVVVGRHVEHGELLLEGPRPRRLRTYT